MIVAITVMNYQKIVPFATLTQTSSALTTDAFQNNGLVTLLTIAVMEGKDLFGKNEAVLYLINCIVLQK